MDLFNRPAFESVRNALIWSLGRIGGRAPVYGPLNLVVPVQQVTTWINVLLQVSDLDDSTTQLTLMQLARRTHDRFRDIDDSLRTQIADRMTFAGVKSHLKTLITEGGSLESEEASLILGEALPVGLRLG